MSAEIKVKVRSVLVFSPMRHGASQLMFGRGRMRSMRYALTVALLKTRYTSFLLLMKFRLIAKCRLDRH